MSLYGDLPTAKDEDAKTSGWAAKKLQPAFRKPGTIIAPPSVARGGGRAGGRTPGAAGRGGGRGPPPATHIVAQSHAGSFKGSNSNTAVQSIHAAFSFFTVDGQPLKHEYDPSKPNDYEDIVKDRERKKREADEEAERLAAMREVEQEIERRKREQAEAAAFVAAAARPPPGVEAPAIKHEPDEDPDAEFTYQGGLGSRNAGSGFIKSEDQAAAAAAGSSVGGDVDDEYERERQRRLKLSGDEAFAARGRRPGAAPDASSGSSSLGGLLGMIPPQQQQQQQLPFGAPKGMGLAQKLLEKMGWREGQGLGRHRQGMATPLVAQKTAAHAGVIVNADLPPDKRQKTGAVFNGPPTRILVLRNMVGPGEVDEELEEEVGNELTKYGNVEDVMIFEVTTPGYPPEEAVRIFIKFDRAEASTRALVDIQGRFFGGRQVRAAFFSEDRFDKQQLAPQAGEFGDN